MLFRLYAAVDIDLSELLKMLNCGIFADFHPERGWYPSHYFVNRPLSSIVHYHRSQPESFNKEYFAIVDRADWKSDGVLAVNLAYEGFIDAARLKANVAGSAIPSVSGRLDWRGAILEFVNRPSFAVYAVADSFEGEPEKLLNALNFGLQSRKDTVVPVCALLLHPAASDDVGPVVQLHAEVVAEGKRDPAYFIFADEADVDVYGVLIVRVSGDGEVDTHRKPVDVAAEVLTWVQAGLYTWQEEKDWDDEQREVEQ